MKCSFCANEIEPGTGNDLVNLDGKILHFCSSKCRKNMVKLGRDPTKVKWTQQYVNESS